MFTKRGESVLTGCERGDSILDGCAGDSDLPDDAPGEAVLAAMECGDPVREASLRGESVLVVNVLEASREGESINGRGDSVLMLSGHGDSDLPRDSELVVFTPSSAS